MLELISEKWQVKCGTGIQVLDDVKKQNKYLCFHQILGKNDPVFHILVTQTSQQWGHSETAFCNTHSTLCNLTKSKMIRCSYCPRVWLFTLSTLHQVGFRNLVITERNFYQKVLIISKAE